MKQGYSETEGKCYPLFFACKNDSLDVRIDGREQMKAKGKRGLQGFLFFLFLAAGWYLMQYFCAYVVLSGSMEPEIPTGSVVVVDGRKKEWNPGDVITYRRGNMVVTHRIVEKSEEGYCTKGDANAEEDAGIVLEKQVIGNVIAALPWRNTLFSRRGSGDAFYNPAALARQKNHAGKQVIKRISKII